MNNDILSIVIDALIAFGTIAVAVLAIWGDWVRLKLAPPRLVVQPHNLRGTVTRFTNGHRVIYYHLKVVNSRPWAVAKNCRVLMRTIYRRTPDQQFSQVPLPIPTQFVWAPAEFTPPIITLSKEQILDFGCLIEGEKHFRPVLYFIPNDFQGYVAPNEAVRFALEVVADGYDSKRYQVFEVAWNGKWSDNLDQMAQNLTIKEIMEND